MKKIDRLIGIGKGDELAKKLSEDTEKIMLERFGKDTIIALATVENEVPFVRYVNAGGTGLPASGTGTVNVAVHFRSTF